MSNQPFISFAQNFEDLTLWRALCEVENGFYVDVGAADPEIDSVTRAFYDRGWSGINIEPFEQHLEKLKEHRPRDTNLMVAVGRESGLRVLHAVSQTGLSTFDAVLAARHRAANWEVSEKLVPVLTLEKIVESFAPPAVHFLKIDVEGAEEDVLLGLNLETFRPWVVVVEATEPTSPVSTRQHWEHLVTGHRYEFAYFDGLNCFYVADEKSELKERLAIPPNVFDDFITFKEWSGRQHREQLVREIGALKDQSLQFQTETQARQTRIEDLLRTVQIEQEQGAYLRSALHTEQNQVVQLQDALGTTQDALRSAQDALHSTQDALRSTQGALGTTQDALRSAQDALHSTQGALHSTQGALHSAQGALDNSQTALANEQARTNQLLQENRNQRTELERLRRGIFGRLRETGDRLTGGGLRALGKRIIKSSTQAALKRPALKKLGNIALAPFPKLSSSLYQLATRPDSVTSVQAASLPNSNAESASKDSSPNLKAAPNSNDFPNLTRPDSVTSVQAASLPNSNAESASKDSSPNLKAAPNSNDFPNLNDLPCSARPVYLRLVAAIRDNSR